MKPESNPVEAVDLCAFIPDEVSVLDVLQRGTGKPTGWKITLAGPSHAKTIAWSTQSAREELRRQAQLEAQQRNGRKVKADEPDVEQVRHDNVARVVARIVDWTPVRLGQNGETLIFSEKAATELLLDPRFAWVYLQLLEFLNDEQSFTQASARN